MTSSLATTLSADTALRRRTRALILAFALTSEAYLAAPLWSQTNVFPASGNVGIGTTSPSDTIEVSGFQSAPLRGGALRISYSPDPANYFARLYTVVDASGDPNRGYLGFQVHNWPGTSVTPMVLTGAGNVGIGTTNPQYLLSVNGTIGTKDVIVTNNGWSDYVFRPGYRLRPLSEVSAYIQANHHLPDIPSETEVKQKGVSLGEMQSKLLAKVEELTLHMIEEHERNDRLEWQNRELQGQVLAIREQNRERMASLANSSPLSPKGKEARQ